MESRKMRWNNAIKASERSRSATSKTNFYPFLESFNSDANEASILCFAKQQAATGISDNDSISANFKGKMSATGGEGNFCLFWDFFKMSKAKIKNWNFALESINGGG